MDIFMINPAGINASLLVVSRMWPNAIRIGHGRCTSPELITDDHVG